MCGIDLGQDTSFSSFRRLIVPELLIPVRPEGGSQVPVWLVRALRELVGWESAPGARHRRLYITRTDAKRRRVANEPEVTRVLRSRGFEGHECAGLTVREQQELFNSASIIVSPHGAAFEESYRRRVRRVGPRAPHPDDTAGSAA